MVLFGRGLCRPPRQHDGNEHPSILMVSHCLALLSQKIGLWSSLKNIWNPQVIQVKPESSPHKQQFAKVLQLGMTFSAFNFSTISWNTSFSTDTSHDKLSAFHGKHPKTSWNKALKPSCTCSVEKSSLSHLPFAVLQVFRICRRGCKILPFLVAKV